MALIRTSRFGVKLFRQQLAIIAFALAASTSIYLWWQRRVVADQVQMRGQTLARMSALLARPAIDGDPEADLDSLLEPTRSEPDVAWIAVYGSDGRLLGGSAGFPEENLLASRVAGLADAGDITVIEPDRGTSTEFYLPVYDERGPPYVMGVVRVSLVDDTQFATQTIFVPVAILAAAVVLLAAALASIVFTQRMVGPLARLTEGAQALGQGRLNVRVQHETGDEIGELADAFNRMASTLEGAFMDLEDTVEERTRELASQRPRLETVLDSVNEGVLVSGPDGTVVLTNRRFKELFGFADVPIVDTHVTDVLDRLKNAVPELPRLLARARRFQSHPAEKSIDQFEIVLPERRVLQRFSAPIRSADGQHIIGRVEIYRDVTREAEVDRMKSEFISTVSHELRTPLTSIKGSLGLILAGATGTLEEESEDLLKIAQQSSERLIRLINDILDISKIESGKMKMNFREGSLTDIVQQTVKGIEPFAARSGVQVQVDLPEEELPVVADPDRIGQVITNLLSNAIKFSPAGAEVRIRTRIRERMYRIQVSDRGPGIADTDIPRLFQKFSQLDEAEGTRSGTGLGLAICRALVEEHGGDIWVQSQEGQGSVFAFTIPRPRVAEATSQHGGPRVLIVDDDPTVTTRLSEYLTAVGFQVTTANSGREAIDAAHEDPPDAITLDLQMPELDGLAVARSLKEDPATSPIPLFFVTFPGADATAAFSLSIADWMTKPVSSDRIVDSVRERISDRAGPSPRVLVVEDDPDIQSQLGRALTSGGFDVAGAVDGSEALARVRERRPDLIILDLAMPANDGFSLVRALRDSRASRRIPLVILSDREIGDRERAALAEGVTRELSKSYRSEDAVLEDMVDLLDGILDNGDSMTADSFALGDDFEDA